MGGAFVAMDDGAFAGYHNPSSMVYLAEGTAEVASAFASVDATYTTPGGASAEAKNHVVAIPSAAGGVPISDRSAAGFIIHSPFGLQLDWPEGSPYRYTSTFSRLQMLSGGPVYAHRFDSGGAVGASLLWNSGSVDLKRAVPSAVFGGPPGGPDAAFDATGTDGALSANLGALWPVNDTFSIGVTYRSPVNLDLEGDAELRLPAGGSIEDDWSMGFDLPQNVALGASWKPAPDWVLNAQMDWIDWSVVDEHRLTFEQDKLEDMHIPRGWNDTLQYRIGAEWNLTKTWALRMGYSYSPSPVPAETLDPTILDSDRHVLAAGVGYRVNDWQLNATYEHTFTESRTVDSSFHRQPTVGLYEGGINTLIISARYAF